MGGRSCWELSPAGMSSRMRICREPHLQRPWDFPLRGSTSQPVIPGLERGRKFGWDRLHFNEPHFRPTDPIRHKKSFRTLEQYITHSKSQRKKTNRFTLDFLLGLSNSVDRARLINTPMMSCWYPQFYDAFLHGVQVDDLGALCEHDYLCKGT